MRIDAILWRRLDAAGHDACRLVREADSWRLEGTAAFLYEGVPACLTYQVDCDGQWRTRAGVVRGWVGSRSLDHKITRSSDGTWSIDGRVVPGLDECVDLDFGFTPATNLIQLRRVALRVGQAADVVVAWLDVPSRSLSALEQRYERRAAESYWYEAPRFHHAAMLRVRPDGFVASYPDLWQAEW